MEWTEEHTAHFDRAMKIRRDLEAEAAELGTPGELAMFVADAKTLLGVGNLNAMTMQLEALTGREL